MTGQTRREQVSFDSAGVACAGILYHPAEPAPGRQPCVVMAHGFTGTMDRLSHYAQRFADAGLTVLTFDYRNFGASGGQPRQLVDIAGQQADWHAAIRFARSRDDIDPDRIALWGSSLGGGHVLTVAADDQRIAAAWRRSPGSATGAPPGTNSAPLLIRAPASWRWLRCGTPGGPGAVGHRCW